MENPLRGRLRGSTSLSQFPLSRKAGEKSSGGKLTWWKFLRYPVPASSSWDRGTAVYTLRELFATFPLGLRSDLTAGSAETRMQREKLTWGCFLRTALPLRLKSGYDRVLLLNVLSKKWYCFENFETDAKCLRQCLFRSIVRNFWCCVLF